VCECAWQQRVRPLTPDLPYIIIETPCLKNINPILRARVVAARAMLTPAQRWQLEVLGYVVLENHLPAAHVAELLKQISEFRSALQHANPNGEGHGAARPVRVRRLGAGPWGVGAGQGSAGPGPFEATLPEPDGPLHPRTGLPLTGGVSHGPQSHSAAA
jgi:hypothetical protein